MTADELKRNAMHESVSGSLERTFSNEDRGEKSLLTLIEEHRPRHSENPSESSPEVGWGTSASETDDFDEDEGYRLDHSLMRLGGNGF